MSARYDVRKKDSIASVQRSLKAMKQEAQEFIEKHHVNLPPICSSRNYLFLSLNGNKAQQKNKKILIPSLNQSQRTSQEQLQNCNIVSKEEKYQPTICNVDIQDFNSLKSEQVHQSTSRKIRRSDEWKTSKRKKTLSQEEGEVNVSKSLTLDMSKQLKKVTINDQTIDVGEKKNLQKKKYILDPRKSHINLQKKYAEAIKKKKILSESKSVQLKKEKMPMECFQSSQTIRTIDYGTVSFDSLANEQKELISTRKRMPRKVPIFYQQELGKKKVVIEKNSKEKLKQKQRENMGEQKRKKMKKLIEESYSPWQNYHNESKDLDEILVDDL